MTVIAIRKGYTTLVIDPGFDPKPGDVLNENEHEVLEAAGQDFDIQELKELIEGKSLRLGVVIGSREYRHSGIMVYRVDILE